MPRVIVCVRPSWPTVIQSRIAPLRLERIRPRLERRIFLTSYPPFLSSYPDFIPFCMICDTNCIIRNTSI